MEATVAQASFLDIVDPSRRTPFLNIFDPAFDYDDPAVAKARERSWFAQTPLGPIVLRHQESWAVLTDRRMVTGGYRYMHKLGITEGPLYDWFVNMLASVDAATHARLRPLVNKAFTPRNVEGLRPFMRALGDELADELAAADGVVEATAAFAERMAGKVMCRMLGVPEDDYPLFHRWSNDLGLVFSRTAEELPRAEAGLIGMSEYVTDLLERRRADLGDDLISKLILAEEEGDRLSAAELHNLVILLVWAGQHTTAKQLGRALVAFAQNPDQWDLLARRPELAPRMVEEVCRWSPQARTTFRFADEDVDYGDLRISAGEMVIVCIASGNRDPRAYDDPDRFDIAAERSAKQLVFGGGPHFCLGAGAARLEMAEGITALARRFHAPVLAGPIEWTPNTSMIHGPDVLPLRFSERADRGEAR